MPGIVGMEVSEAKDLLSSMGINTKLEGPDGKQFAPNGVTDVIVRGSNVPAGATVQRGDYVTMTIDETEDGLVARAEASQKAAEASRMATRYEFTCTTGTSTYTDKPALQVQDFRAVWTAPAFGSLKKCDVSVNGQSRLSEFSLIGNEQAIVDNVAAHGGDTSIPSSALVKVLEACALPPAIGFDASMGTGNNRVEAIAIAALDICGDAPFADELTRIASGQPPARMTDGTYTVGTAIQPGTYQAEVPSGAIGVQNCYWERTTGQGGTIANDFISYAPQGPVVSVFAGEGFVSKGCGTWNRIG